MRYACEYHAIGKRRERPAKTHSFGLKTNCHLYSSHAIYKRGKPMITAGTLTRIARAVVRLAANIRGKQSYGSSHLLTRLRATTVKLRIVISVMIDALATMPMGASA